MTLPIIVTSLKRDGNRIVTYRYRAGPDMFMKFHLLSEVGEAWQEPARRELNRLCNIYGCVVTQKELDNAPWYVDVLVPAPDRKPS